MKSGFLFILGLTAIMAFGASGRGELAQIRSATEQFQLNPSLGVYILHIWVWTDNPSGIFEAWNPNVACL